MNSHLRLICLAFVVLVRIAQSSADDTTLIAIPDPETKFHGVDTLKCDTDMSPDAQECLTGLRWTPGDFEIRCEAADDDRGDLRIRFPSPIDTGNKDNDNVAMEWYVVRETKCDSLFRLAAMVIVHESGRGMTVGRILAKGLNAQGLHTFLIHLPGYGNRKSEFSGRPEFILTGMKQAIADVRRARDVVIKLPLVEQEVVGVQGTSLGGFVTSSVAGLDRGYERVFVLLAGGNLADVVVHGAKDAANVRANLKAIGVSVEQIPELTRPIEPLRLAHRIESDHLWLYSGKYDDVVPPASSFAFAKAAKLPEGHHIELLADHYSGVVFLPMVIQQIRKKMDDAEEIDLPSE